MTNLLIEMFSYKFMQYALISGLLISLCASLIGSSLVLRKNSMLGDGLSHVGFASFALATVLNTSPLEFAMPIVILISFLILKINNSKKMQNDSIIALISASSLAIGTFTISIVKGVNTDINNYLFGSILSIGEKEVIISIILSIIILFIFIFSYNQIFAITFDEKFAKSIGVNTNFYNILFAILCSIVVVLGMRLVGALLISSLLIFPPLSAMQYFKTFKSVVISSVIIGTISFILGLVLSFVLSTPTGSTIVLINLMIFILFKLFSFYKTRRKQWV